MNNQYRPRGSDYDYDNGPNGHHRKERRRGSANVETQSLPPQSLPPAPFYPPPPPQPSAVRHRQSENDRYRVHDGEAVERREVNPKLLSPFSRAVPIVRLIVDVVLVALAWIPLILLNTVAKPFERGFYCDDESIRYPYKTDTITSATLYAVGATIVIVVIVIVEIAIAFSTPNGQKPMYGIKGRPVHPLLSSLYIYLGYCVVGFIMVQIATDICKNMVGRLRPHFISACDPDWEKINCSGFQYVQEPFCQTTNEKRLKDARVSFLSGHSSYSAYMMFYLVFYLQARWRWPQHSLMGKHFLQFGFVMLALFTGLSRISDYKHHWSDVMSGFALGTLGACLTALHIGKFFKREAYAMRETGSKEDQGYPMFGARYAANEHGKPVY